MGADSGGREITEVESLPRPAEEPALGEASAAEGGLTVIGASTTGLLAPQVLIRQQPLLDAPQLKGVVAPCD